MATNGLVLIKPSSTAVTGASATATINTGGSVTFDLCETLSLNDVFSSTYDNYIIDIRMVNDTTDANLFYRLRLSGTDATGSNYTYQMLLASSTTITGARATTTYGFAGDASNDQRDGLEMFMYGPNLAQPTATRSVTSAGRSNARIVDWACTHSLSTAYDGVTVYPVSGSISGLVKVYGLVK